MPATLGSVTVSAFEHDPEAHKLHIEFEVQTAQSVHPADPVILATNGRVQAAGAAAPVHTVIGVALKEVAAGLRVTVAMKAYCVVIGEAAAATFNAGICQLGAWNGTTLRREYAVSTADAAGLLVTIGHNLTQAVADGDVVKVALLL